MKTLEIAKDALRTIWTSKGLWVFGLFLGAGGGGAGGQVKTDGAKGGVAQALPGWLVPVLIAAAVVGLVALVLHVVSEAALIQGVRASRSGQPVRVRPLFRDGLRHFLRVLGVKALAAGLALATVVALGGSVATLLFAGAPKWLPLALAVVGGLAAIPWLVTLYLVYLYALRVAVVDGVRVRSAFAEARRFLSGRVLDSLKLLVVQLAGQLGGALAAVVAMLPGAAVGLGVYLAAGLIPGLVVGAVLALPAAVVAAGAIGAFESALWTVSFLEGRAEQAR
jgi:hypothetical protein